MDTRLDEHAGPTGTESQRMEGQFNITGGRSAIGLGKDTFRSMDEDETGSTPEECIASVPHIGHLAWIHAVFVQVAYDVSQKRFDPGPAIDDSICHLARIVGRRGIAGIFQDSFQQHLIHGFLRVLSYGAAALQKAAQVSFLIQGDTGGLQQHGVHAIESDGLGWTYANAVTAMDAKVIFPSHEGRQPFFHDEDAAYTVSDAGAAAGAKRSLENEGHRFGLLFHRLESACYWGSPVPFRAASASGKPPS